MIFLEIEGFHLEAFKSKEFKGFINPALVEALPDNTYERVKEEFVERAFCEQGTYDNFIKRISYDMARTLLNEDESKTIQNTLFESGLFYHCFCNKGYSKDKTIQFVELATLTLALELLISYYPVLRQLNFDLVERYANKHGISGQYFPRAKAIDMIKDIYFEGARVSDYIGRVTYFVDSINKKDILLKLILEEEFSNKEKFTQLIDTLPYNSIDIAVKVLDRYKYKEMYKELPHSLVATMCSSIAHNIIKTIDSTYDNYRKEEINKLIIHDFLVDNLKCYGYTPSATMKETIKSCYHNILVNVFSKECVLDFLKNIKFEK